MVLHRVHHQILRSHHLFEPLDEAQLNELMSSSQLLSVDKGEPLFRQGEPADAFYFVIAGAVKIYRLTPDGQEKVFEVIGERQTFAEAMMLMDTPNYVACAEAVCPTQLYRLSNATYMRLLQSNSRLTFALLGKLCVRLHQRVNEIETLSLKNATHRVVRYLLTQLVRLQSTTDCSFELPMAKQLIAGHLSIQPETFSRIIRRLIDEKIITQDGRQIAILDRPRLEQFSENLPGLPARQCRGARPVRALRHTAARGPRQHPGAPTEAFPVVLPGPDAVLRGDVLLVAQGLLLSLGQLPIQLRQALR